MEDDLNGRQPKWKTTSIEYNPNGRRPQGEQPQQNETSMKWKEASVENYQNGRQPKWKTT